MRNARRLAAITAVACLGTTACSAAEQAENQAESGGGEEDVLTVSVFGGSWGSAIEDNIIEPFEAEHDVTVRPVESTSTLALGKLRQDPAVFDVALLDSGVSELARQDDLVSTIAEGDLSNLSELSDRAVLRDDDGVWAVTMGFWALGIAYNTDEVEQAPTSWSDLWSDKYAGSVTVPTPDTTGGLPMLVQAASMDGGDAHDVAPGFAKLAEMDVAAYFDSSGTADNLMQSGEAVIGAHYNPGAWPMADQGLPIEWIAPKEGALAADSRWHVTTGTTNEDLAVEFIDFASSQDAQQGLAEDLYVAPANSTVELSDEVGARMPYGPNGSLDDLQFSDWNLINQHRSEWTKEWNKVVAQ